VSLLRKLLFTIYSLFNFIILKLNRVEYNDLDIDGRILIHNKGTFRIGKGARINSSPFKNIIGGDTRSSIVIKKQGQLTIGKNFKMSNSAIYCANSITIGDDVMIGGSCKIWDTDFHPLNADKRRSNPNEEYSTRPVVIGNNVFIGGFSIILKGVTIGDSSVIGAGSVVSRAVPSGEVWAGNPASFIRKINSNENS
jgi:acetyltransferase-like isoleucine patch superfamily enzyme